MVNDLLRSISQDISAGAIRGNISSLIAIRLRDIEKHGLPQIPPGVDQNLMASLGVDNNYRILDFMREVSLICLFDECLPWFLHAFTLLHSIESTNM